MRRVSFAVLGVCLAALAGVFAASPSAAGDYYYSGGRYSGGNVWYSSDCCYRKVVRHSRSVHYERTYRSSGYYGRGYGGSAYYEQPYYSNGYRGYSSYRSYDVRPAGYYGYDGYACTNRYRVRVADGRGGWVWARGGGC